MARSILVARGLGCFGQAAAFALAQEGHKVFIGLPQLGGPAYRQTIEFALSSSLDLHPVQLDLSDFASISQALELVFGETYCLDALIHEIEPANPPATTRANGITEKRMNWFQRNLGGSLEQAVIAHMSRRRCGLLTRIENPSAAGSPPPQPLCIGAEEESNLAQVARCGVECCTILPRLPLHSRDPETEINASYIAKVIAELVSRPKGERPQRVFVLAGAQKINQAARGRVFRRCARIAGPQHARPTIAAE